MCCSTVFTYTLAFSTGVFASPPVISIFKRFVIDGESSFFFVCGVLWPCGFCPWSCCAGSGPGTQRKQNISTAFRRQRMFPILCLSIVAGSVWNVKGPEHLTRSPPSCNFLLRQQVHEPAAASRLPTLARFVRTAFSAELLLRLNRLGRHGASSASYSSPCVQGDT